MLKLYSKIQPSNSKNEFNYPSIDADVSDVIKISEIEEEFNFDQSHQILTESKEAQLATRFKKDADAIYIEAKRSVVSSISKVPIWFYVALLVLG